ncbi:DoxX family protein [Flavobacteriaceae bacterium]|jgi:tellurite resistance protein TehA-like permease|nr:DoxX family protein [Flavobacteriaceae bacterium]
MEHISLIFQMALAISVYYVWIFRYHNVLSEFSQFGYSDLFRNFVGAAKISLSALLIMGVFYDGVTLFAALGMAIFMLGAQVTHLRVKNPLKQRIPSLILLLISLFIAAFHFGLL